MMQLAAVAARPTPFQRQVGQLVTKLEDALYHEDGTYDADRTFAAIDGADDVFRSAFRLKSSDESKHDLIEAVGMLGDAREVIGTNWSQEPPHVDRTYGDVGRAGVREAVGLLKQVIDEA
jgi:hypothetical protein